ncbi:MAG: serine/threonine protein kinase [Gammaproteobacteria bacterium]|jgi:Ser/Thr protein kinase RdoA (MazF antagonist)
MEETNSLHPYERLTPEAILHALESRGLACDGRLLALNSYENRVYQVGVEDGAPVIAKFYRPGRWSRRAILEEHGFAGELATHEIPVVAPLADPDGVTLHEYGEFLFAVYPRCGGRWVELDSRQRRNHMGRLLGRIHAVGAAGRFQHRSRLDIETLGERPRRFILDGNLLPPYLIDAYATLTDDLLRRIRVLFEAAGHVSRIRLHGDCHPGNILWTDSGPHFVDLDDSCTGPPIQDLWMLLSGQREEMRVQLEELLEGYQTFFDFDFSSVILIEALRTLRIMRYSAWIAGRWGDPAFPRAFPWFDSPRYWEDHILTLREQAAAMDEPLVL